MNFLSFLGALWRGVRARPFFKKSALTFLDQVYFRPFSFFKEGIIFIIFIIKQITFPHTMFARVSDMKINLSTISMFHKRPFIGTWTRVDTAIARATSPRKTHMRRLLILEGKHAITQKWFCIGIWVYTENLHWVPPSFPRGGDGCSPEREAGFCDRFSEVASHIGSVIIRIWFEKSWIWEGNHFLHMCNTFSEMSLKH